MNYSSDMLKSAAELRTEAYAVARRHRYSATFFSRGTLHLFRPVVLDRLTVQSIFFRQSGQNR